MPPASAITFDEKKGIQVTRAQAPAERRTRTVLTPNSMLAAKGNVLESAVARNEAVSASKIPSSVTMILAFDQEC